MKPELIRKNYSRACDHLVLHQKEDVYWLSAPLLEKEQGAIHGFSTRLGGVSSGEVGAMNLGFAREENKENVKENYRRIADAIGFDPKRLVLTWQTHTRNVMTVHEEDAGYGITRERPYKDVDALVTNVPGITLVCFSADCVPVLFWDPVVRAAGCAHSGWRGTVQDIAGAVVERMKEEYGSSPENIVAAIGPSICQDCYEVGEEVIEEFARTYEPALHDLLFYRKENGKYQLNLWEAVRQNLLRAGLTQEHISLPDVCTRCNPSVLFSHRVQHGKQGMLGAFIGIAK